MTDFIWNKNRDELLISQYRRTPNKLLAIEFNVSESFIKKKAKQLNLRKDKSNTLKAAIVDSILEIGVDKYSYNEIADKLGCHRNTVRKYVSELVKAGFLCACSARQVGDKISRIRQTIVKKERGRVIFGMDQHTDIKVFGSRKKMEMRKRLRRYGYAVERGGAVALICPDTDRYPISEAAARRLGITIDLDWEAFEGFPGCGSAEEDIMEEISENS